MRCRRAQRLMAAAVDGEVTARERAALDRHLGDCATCGHEMAATASLMSALGHLPMEAAVAAGVEQATLRRVRLLADDDRSAAGRRWWLSLPMPALVAAVAVVLAVSVGLLRQAGEVPVVARTAPAQAPVRVAHAPVAAEAVVHAGRPSRPGVALPDEPPPALAAAPDLFMDLPILRNLEKLRHFDTIRTTTLDAPPAADGQPDENG